MYNFMKILPVETELFHADIWRKGRTDRQTHTQTVRHDEANNRFSHSFKNIQHFEVTKK